MEKLIASLILTVLLSTSFGQNKKCSLWLGEPYSAVSTIKNTAEKYLQFNLKQSGRGDTTLTFYEMEDSLELSKVTVFLDHKRTLIGNSIQTTTSISSVTISGIEERIERLYDYLKAIVTPCSTDTSNTYVFWGKSKIYIERPSRWAKDIPTSKVTITSQ